MPGGLGHWRGGRGGSKTAGTQRLTARAAPPRPNPIHRCVQLSGPDVRGPTSITTRLAYAAFSSATGVAVSMKNRKLLRRVTGRLRRRAVLCANTVLYAMETTWRSSACRRSPVQRWWPAAAAARLGAWRSTPHRQLRKAIRLKLATPLQTALPMLTTSPRWCARPHGPPSSSASALLVPIGRPD